LDHHGSRPQVVVVDVKSVCLERRRPRRCRPRPCR
jgi:hypothetical protein